MFVRFQYCDAWFDLFCVPCLKISSVTDNVIMISSELCFYYGKKSVNLSSFGVSVLLTIWGALLQSFE